MAKRAIIVIDMLADFITGDLSCERARSIVPQIAALLDAARKHNIPIIYVNDAHLEKIDGELSLWGNHAMAGSTGAQVVDALAPQKEDYVIEKRRYSAFFQTGLKLLLDELNIDTVVLTGVQAHICLCHTAADAFYWTYKIEVPADGTEAFDDDCYALAFRWLKDMYGVKPTAIKEILAAIEEKEKKEE